MHLEDYQKAKEYLNKLGEEVIHSDASDNQKRTILNIHAGLTLMVGIVMGTIGRYESLLLIFNSLEKPEGLFVSGSCEGEVCSICGQPAERKIGEEIPFDDPDPNRHNLTAYVCYLHFKMIVTPGPKNIVPREVVDAPQDKNTAPSLTRDSKTGVITYSCGCKDDGEFHKAEGCTLGDKQDHVVFYWNEWDEK